MPNYTYQNSSSSTVYLGNKVFSPSNSKTYSSSQADLDAVVPSSLIRFVDGVLDNNPYDEVVTTTTALKTINGNSLFGTGDLAVASTLAPANVAASINLVAATHANRTLYDTAAGNITLTIQDDATGGTSADAYFRVMQNSTGTVTFAAGVGVTLTIPAGFTASSFGSGTIVGVVRTGANTWVATERPMSALDGVSRLVSTYSEIQAAHDEIVAAGGGTLHFAPRKIFVWPSNATTITVDSFLVTLSFNRSEHDLTALPNGAVAFNVVSTNPNVYSSYMLRTMSDGKFFTNVAGDQFTTGATAFKFDSPTNLTTNTIQLHRIRIRGMLKGMSFGSRSYFVRVYDSNFNSCRHGLFQEASPSDFAEKITFVNCVFGGNHSHLTDSAGQIWTFNFCSFDYHIAYLMNLSFGARVYANSCHFEWRYGENSGETNSPFTIAGENTSIFVRGGAIAYTGTGQNPFYASTVSCDRASQKIIFDVDTIDRIGVLSNPNSLDTFAICSASVMPIVSLRGHSIGNLVDDAPSMSVISESVGSFGQLRNGVDNPHVELVHRTGLTGTAAISNVTIDENGVTRKNAKNMIKITGIGKVLICLPNQEANRRHAWTFWTNPAFMTGSATIKERQTGFGTKFDGTTATMVADTRGAVYSGTIVTVNSGANAWTRRSWKDTTTAFYPSYRQNMASVTMIEIDTALMTAGALYISYFGFDVL